MQLPLMDTGRARGELGWSPRYSAREAITEFVSGLREGAGMPTAPLAATTSSGRAQEVRTGVGAHL